MKLSSHLFIGILLLTILSCAAPKPEETLQTKLQSKLDSLVAKTNIPGAVFAYTNKEGESFAIAYGFSNPDEKIQIKKDQILFSGSIGKTYCAAVIMQLVEENKFKLDTKVADLLKDEEWYFQLPNANDITIRMLLNHTSGLPRWVFVEEVWETLHKSPDKVWSVKDRMQMILNHDAIHPAGEGWAYSDSNFLLLGLIIEKTTGNEYYSEVIKRILKPLKLEETFAANQRKINNLATGYTSMTNAPFNLPHKMVENGQFFFNPQMEFTGGGFVCTVSDLSKWSKFYWGGELLSKESINNVLTNNHKKTTLGDQVNYGFATMIWTNDGEPYYGHTGFVPGYRAYTQYFPEFDFSIALQINQDYIEGGYSTYDFLGEARDLIIQEIKK